MDELSRLRQYLELVVKLDDIEKEYEEGKLTAGQALQRCEELIRTLEQLGPRR